MRGIVTDTAPESILRRTLKDVIEHKKTYNMMWFKTHHKRKDALGFAGNQLNIDANAFLAKINYKWMFFANPIIVRTSSERNKSHEACLSIPNKDYIVDRYDWVELDYEDDFGVNCSRIFKGLDAIVIQHEVDHLNGILISDKGEKNG